MNNRIQRKGTNNTIGLVATEFSRVFMHFGGLVVALDADEATDFADALLAAAGEVRGNELANLLPGVRFAA